MQLPKIQAVQGLQTCLFDTLSLSANEQKNILCWERWCDVCVSSILFDTLKKTGQQIPAVFDNRPLLARRLASHPANLPRYRAGGNASTEGFQKPLGSSSPNLHGQSN